jgi:hypothetical protein
MQLEETASSKDVPPLSSLGVFELPEFVAQHNMCPVWQNTDLCGFLISNQPVRKQTKSLVC